MSRSSLQMRIIRNNIPSNVNPWPTNGVIPAMHSPSNRPPSPDLLLAATLFLMSQHALQPRRTVAQAVVDHLDRLMTCTDLLSARMLLALPRLREHWASVARRPRPVPASGNVIFFERAVR